MRARASVGLARAPTRRSRATRCFHRASAPERGISASPARVERFHRAHGSSTHRILVVGEGDFSFALALARCAPRGWEITATSLHSLEATETSWEGGANVEALRAMDGARVAHGVDATRLSTTFERGAFDRVCFNFPHAAGKGKIHANRALLGGYIREALLVAPRGTIEVALAPGQGGTAADGARAREYGNSWQAYARGAENGALLIECAPFDDAGWRALGYESRGHWRSARAERGFQTAGGVAHVFCAEDRARELGATCAYATPFTRDVSVWTDDADSDDAERVVVDAFDVARDGADVSADVRRVDAWRDPESGRVSVTLRACVRSTTVPLTPVRVRAFVDRARDVLRARRRLRDAATGDGEDTALNPSVRNRVE